ncbi:MAG: hypothetical protein A2007_01125 [Verrucomicrobia bacterium GWC2_42_7]|nr:MAG: hypothetical protein A2007_01125 [Verrucomicrobia bacterium GWC2_42_7]
MLNGCFPREALSSLTSKKFPYLPKNNDLALKVCKTLSAKWEVLPPSSKISIKAAYLVDSFYYPTLAYFFKD